MFLVCFTPRVPLRNCWCAIPECCFFVVRLFCRGQQMPHNPPTCSGRPEYWLHKGKPRHESPGLTGQTWPHTAYSSTGKKFASISKIPRCSLHFIENMLTGRHGLLDHRHFCKQSWHKLVRACVGWTVAKRVSKCACCIILHHFAWFCIIFASVLSIKHADVVWEVARRAQTFVFFTIEFTIELCDEPAPKTDQIRLIAVIGRSVD